MRHFKVDPVLKMYETVYKHVSILKNSHILLYIRKKEHSFPGFNMNLHNAYISFCIQRKLIHTKENLGFIIESQEGLKELSL